MLSTHSRDLFSRSRQPSEYKRKETSTSREPLTKDEDEYMGKALRLLAKFHFPENKFSLYFMGFEDSANIPTDEDERTKWLCAQKASLELTHNWGSENNPEIKYHNGNLEPKGFGHIGFAVPDVEKACERFEKLGVTFVKKPSDGKMKGIAFVQDPDGYWIEIFSGENLLKITKEFA